jgi:hypothetical protein
VAMLFPALGAVVLWRAMAARRCSKGVRGIFIAISRTSLMERLARQELGVSYGLVSVAILLLFAMLPAIAYFKVAYQNEIRLFVRYSQQDILSQMEDRFDLIDRARKNSMLDMTPATWNDVETIADNSRGSYHKIFFNSRIETTAVCQHEALRTFDKQFLDVVSGSLAELNPPYNLIAIAARRMWQMPADSDWKPQAEAQADAGPTKILLHKHHYQGDKTIQIASELPFYETDPLAVILLPPALIFLMYLYLRIVVRPLVDQVFLLKTKAGLPVQPAPAKVHRHTLLLLSAWNTVDYLSSRGEAVDFAELALAGKTRDVEISPAATAKSLLCIRNFEFRMDDPEMNAIKLEFLEKLLYSYPGSLLIQSHVDPVYHLEANGLNDDELNRWRTVICRFEVVVVEDPPDPDFEARLSRFGNLVDKALSPQARERLRKLFTRESRWSQALREIGTQMLSGNKTVRDPNDLISEFGARAQHNFERVWLACSTEERLVLYHFAKFGFLNAADGPTIQQLLRKRLIMRDPFLFSTVAFRRYVLATQNPQAAKILAEKSKGGWDAISGNVALALVSVAAILFVAAMYSQKEVLQSYLSYIPVAAGALATLAKLVSGRGESKAGPPAG